jgi:predicted nucleotidyltransferase
MHEHSQEIQAYGVKRLGLFGSCARATQRPDSDIDFLVEFARGRKSFDNYMDLKFYLERVFHRKVDLVIKDTLKPRIKKSVLAEVKYA